MYLSVQVTPLSSCLDRDSGASWVPASLESSLRLTHVYLQNGVKSFVFAFKINEVKPFESMGPVNPRQDSGSPPSPPPLDDLSDRALQF